MDLRLQILACTPEQGKSDLILHMRTLSRPISSIIMESSPLVMRSGTQIRVSVGLNVVNTKGAVFGLESFSNFKRSAAFIHHE